MRRKERGFTLIEVMVALVIVATALPALMVLVSSQLQGASYIREKTQAFWIAENQLARLQLRRELLTNTRLPRTENGTLTLNGLEWYWQLDTQDTEVPGFKRIDIAVSFARDKDEPLANIAGFMDE